MVLTSFEFIMWESGEKEKLSERHKLLFLLPKSHGWLWAYFNPINYFTEICTGK